MFALEKHLTAASISLARDCVCVSNHLKWSLSVSASLPTQQKHKTFTSFSTLFLCCVLHFHTRDKYKRAFLSPLNFWYSESYVFTQQFQAIIKLLIDYIRFALLPRTDNKPTRHFGVVLFQYSIDGRAESSRESISTRNIAASHQ